MAGIHLEEWQVDSLWIPFFASLLSAAALLSRSLPSAWIVSEAASRNPDWREFEQVHSDEDASQPLLGDNEGEVDDESRPARKDDLVKSREGRVILAFEVVRLLGLISLLGLSLLWPCAIHHSPRSPITACYSYATLLSSLALLVRNHERQKELERHVTLVLLTVFGVFAYRDIWPLATYTQKPVDADEGAILWAKTVILTITSVLVPLFVPRRYVPLDPEYPSQTPHPEQTASIFSMTVYTYLDSLIFQAYKLPHLSHTRLPSLPDYDHTEHLVEKAFPHLDPFRGAKRQHLFFGILRIFSKEFCELTVIIVCLAASNYIPAIALNKVLAYLESGPSTRQSNIRPWFWVLCLFLGPFCVALFLQRYAYTATTLVARTQAIMTQLIYEHSLRVRVVAEKSGSDAGKGKGKADTDKALGGRKENNLVGKINTMVAVDVGNLSGGKDFLMIILQGPIELSIATAILWDLLGWSSIVGLVSIILLLPLPGYIGKKMQTIHQNRMRKTDARVQSVVEMLHVIRMIKMFGWEDKMRKTLDEKREEELAWLWKDKMINLVNELINFIIPTITMLATYATYTLIMKESLNASKVFASAAVFTSVRGLMRRTSTLFGLAVKAKVSLDRISKFLLETELLDRFSQTASLPSWDALGTDAYGTIGFKNAGFIWSKVAEDAVAGSQSSQNFILRVPGELRFKHGGINLIFGPTGSGKTSILMALLGEMHFISMGPDSWYHLPRHGGVAYAAQESWVLNDTIKNNILFGLPYDEERYNMVISQCALARDLEHFDAGDDTEVGERGLTLSGGQKARVSLARAIYSSARILLLDDVFASLDTHTARWIVNECFQGDLIHDRTILLVTHNLALLGPVADFIVSVGSDGIARNLDIGNTRAALFDDSIFNSKRHLLEGNKEQGGNDNLNQDRESARKGGKLIFEEEVALGSVSTKSYSLFVRGLGGDGYIHFVAFWIFNLFLMHGGSMLAVWFLGHWGSQYEEHKPADVNVPYFLFAYSAILLASMIAFSLAILTYNYGTQRASRTINQQLIKSVLTSTLQWIDRTPVSRIISRCSQDIASIDDRLPDYVFKAADMFLSVLVKFTAPILLTPIFLLPGGMVMMLGIFLCQMYLKAQMSLKRETSNARSPVLAHFGVTLAGLTSIRAYDAQERFKAVSLARINHYIKVFRASNDINRWIGIRIDLLGASFAGTLGWYLVSEHKLNAANTGFSLTMSLEFCTIILWLLRNWNLLEIEANSLERVQAYLDIEHEPEATEAGKPPLSWPRSGELHVENLTARYAKMGPIVLSNVSFHVNSGERVGIVGRTGSGKSSLTLSLLRLIFTNGLVLYDGLPTDKINLSDLRANITIIPQVPELLSGSLRRNLDPFEAFDDAILNDALQCAGFFTLKNQTEDPQSGESGKVWTLDSEISSAGGNLSTGQRQVIALARAILRRSTVLILDEATSAIDFETDLAIQSALKDRLGANVTVLVVAHRLRTVMDADKIIVLDKGQVVESGAPRSLLQNQGGYFRSLVEASGDRELLYTLVR